MSTEVWAVSIREVAKNIVYKCHCSFWEESTYLCNTITRHVQGMIPDTFYSFEFHDHRKGFTVLLLDDRPRMTNNDQQGVSRPSPSPFVWTHGTLKKYKYVYYYLHWRYVCKYYCYYFYYIFLEPFVWTIEDRCV